MSVVTPRQASTSREARKVLKEAVTDGWEIRLAIGRGHPRIVKGRHLVVFAMTGGKGRGTRNMQAQIKRCERGCCEH